ncbi:MAG: septal ring lytic transglycosylase RlpA family protein [Fibrobacterota bacterium]
MLLGACSASPRYSSAASGASSSPRRGKQRVEESGHAMQGHASWYGRKFHGRTTASGEAYNMRDMTAAHKTLPFGTRVRVTDLDTDRSVTVRINDRGPFVEGRIIDLSRRAADRLGIRDKGTANVKLEIR